MESVLLVAMKESEQEDHMAHMTEAEARAALDEAERRRRQVTDEIGMPRWYWWGLALAWIGLGFVIDLGNPWSTAIATFAFGAVHAAVYGQVMGGRRRTGQLRIHTDIVGRHGSLLMLAALVGLGVVRSEEHTSELQSLMR